MPKLSQTSFTYAHLKIGHDASATPSPARQFLPSYAAYSVFSTWYPGLTSRKQYSVDPEIPISAGLERLGACFAM